MYCSICLEDNPLNIVSDMQGIKLSCKHEFHEYCLYKYYNCLIKNNRFELNCPLCRTVNNIYLMKLTCKQINKNKLNQILLKKDVLKTILQKKSNKFHIYFLQLVQKKINKKAIFNYLLSQDNFDLHVKQIEYNIYIYKKLVKYQTAIINKIEPK